MTSSASSLDSSFVLWALAALVALMAAHVLLGWIRQAQEAEGRARTIAAGIGASCFAIALNAASALALESEGHSFPIGFHYAALTLFVLTVAAAVPMALLPAHRQGLLSSLGSGLLFGALMVATQCGWIAAVGYKPGVTWSAGLVTTGWMMSAMGATIAFMLAFPSESRAAHFRYSWRIASATILALSFLLGSALVIAAARVPAQTGAAYSHHLSGMVMALIGGGLAPLVLLALAIDLELRRRKRRRQHRQRRRMTRTVASRWDFAPVGQPVRTVAPSSGWSDTGRVSAFDASTPGAPPRTGAAD